MLKSSHVYRIGKVSKITGISPDTLRIWERRYSVVIPQRSQAGGRLYAADDIVRLKLIKNLIDEGDTISNLAALTQEQLQARLVQNSPQNNRDKRLGPFKLCTVGPSIAMKLEQSGLKLKNFEHIAQYRDIASLTVENTAMQADLLIIELSTLQVETALQIVDLVHQMNAFHAIVIYRFSAKDALRKLPESKCSVIRAPLDIDTLIQRCDAISVQVADASVKQAGQLDMYAPPRRYDDAALAQISSLSPTIKCECPHHLAELLASLSAFEAYSYECESRNQQDAELHIFLSKTASHARHMIEDALEMVLQIEGIQL